ncbi:PBP1A family penicillin-binding protein, partial [Massilia arenosa]
MPDDTQPSNAFSSLRDRLRTAFGGHARRASGYVMARPPWQRVVLVGLIGAAVLLMALFLYVLILIPLTPDSDDLKQARTATATVLVSADGKQLSSFEQGLQERVTLKQISPFVVSALISTEDHRFYEHHGIDFRRSVGALIYTAKGDMQGGSTITQQLARNMFPEEIGRSRSINRKLKEMVTAIKIEATLTKPEILEAYLNTVPFLYNTFGIEMAARTYFGKPAAKLDILEAATLVGMLKGTNYYNPVTNPERSLERRNVVLGQMLKHGVITQARFAQLKKRPLRLHFTRLSNASNNDNDSHFTNMVRKWLIAWADENDYNLQRDGLVVHTTIDSALQEAAQKAVEKQAASLQAVADVEWGLASPPESSSLGDFTGMRSSVKPFDYFWKSHGDLLDSFVRESGAYRRAVAAGEEPKAVLKRLRADGHFMSELRASKSRLESGFVAIDPRTGEIRAWVGSRDYKKDQFDHVAQAERQPGSTFKPVVYGAALEKGFSPDKQYRDVVTDIRMGGVTWRPTDMHGSTGAMMTMRDGLALSKNTITAQVMQDVGLPAIVKLGRDLGIRDSKLSAVPSLALGTSPVTLLEMTNAYVSIANQGEYRKPQFVSSITDRNGKILAQFGPNSAERAMSQAGASALLDMMRGVVNRGTGTAVRWRFGVTGDVAGKTGTTQRNTDGWFILMHPQLVAGAWVGFNDNRVTIRSSYWGQGGHNALLLVGDFFKSALEAKRIDAAAMFPGGRPPPPVRPQEETEEVMEDAGSMQDENGVIVNPEDLHPKAEQMLEDEEPTEPEPEPSAPPPPAPPAPSAAPVAPP